MARSRSAARSAPSRPTVPARAPAPQQTRPAATYAPAQQQHAPAPTASAPQASQGPGLFGQMASTAAGVAVGSTIGHAIGGLFSGGSDSAPAEASPQAQAQQQQGQWGNNCQGATQSFTKCMDEQGGNMQICGWYLDQLKACQAAASQY
ncbi:uncharacterized protein GGS22DRAFT_166217 [Annulohypoxylon maeteangense]|uniref:uncharacterized protein n=1 Tax=Annulohypoxylon maeteangense TaxID=1927788 RepID=UPI002007E8FC|nr:uncharacterized protein GGS22DRAFT_166217 [Annulohypoxylon maeteangense]KAI0883841.1 hypothetical protein GGS22DRAFT_166217 [Annulohypoxylon maeteangense]